MRVLSWILKAIAIFYAIGTVAYMMGGDPNNPPPPGVWVLTAVIAGVFWFAASKVDAKITKESRIEEPSQEVQKPSIAIRHQ